MTQQEKWEQTFWADNAQEYKLSEHRELVEMKPMSELALYPDGGGRYYYRQGETK